MRKMSSLAAIFVVLPLLVTPWVSNAQTCSQVFDASNSLVKQAAATILTPREKNLFLQAHREGATLSSVNVSAYAPEATLMMETLREGRSTFQSILKAGKGGPRVEALRALVVDVDVIETRYLLEKRSDFKYLNYEVLNQILDLYLKIQQIRYVLEEGSNVETGVVQMETLVMSQSRRFRDDFPYDILVPSAEKYGFTPLRASNLGLHFIGLMKMGERTIVDGEDFTDAALPTHDLGHAVRVARGLKNPLTEALSNKRIVAELFRRKLETNEIVENIWLEIATEFLRETPTERKILLTIVRFYIEHELGLPLNSREGQDLVARIASGRDVYRTTEVIAIRIRNKRDLGARIDSVISESEILSIVQKMHRHFSASAELAQLLN